MEHLERKDSKADPSRNEVKQKPPIPCFLKPHVYETLSAWNALKPSSQRGLERGSLLKVVSWNIDWSRPDPAARGSAALGELKRLFGETTEQLVVMFQEVCVESLHSILEDPWVRGNFALSNTRPPDSVYTDVPGESFIMRNLEWKAAPYFTLMMISKDLDILECFRAPFTTGMGRDALVVDIPIADFKDPRHSTGSIRLCTTHLESLYGGKAYRPGQLAVISALLKGTAVSKSQIVGGLVGGDMNSIDRPEHEFHRREDIGLNDVWEDLPAPPVPKLKPFQKDLSYGRARGNTWGYQSDGPRARKRMDKFLYTGSIGTAALSNIHDVTGKLGRLGIGLKTEVEAWERNETKLSVVRGEIVRKPHTKYLSERDLLWEQNHSLFCRHLPRDPPIRTQINTWVSDHFGIAVGVRVL